MHPLCRGLKTNCESYPIRCPSKPGPKSPQLGIVINAAVDFFYYKC